MTKDNEIKKQLSYAYKILAYLKLDDHTYAHLSSRSSDNKSYYIYPFGLRFEEVRPENLLQISLEGEVLDGNEFQYNQTGYVIHGSIYSARADINSIFHIHSPNIVAVSSCKQGLLPISQFALHFYDKISYHDYNSLSLNESQGLELTKDLAENFNILLRNHGSISCGRTIQEAMFYTYHLEQACKTQCLALAMNTELIIPNKETCSKSVEDLLSFEKDLGIRDWNAWVRKII